MRRIRDFGLQPGILPTGIYNAITDVPGVMVGQVTLNEGDDVRTGVTAILPHHGNLFEDKVPAAVYTINGFGKACGFEQVREMGHIETPILLTNTLNVPRVADALLTYMLAQNPRIGKDSTGTVNPLVGECNDGFVNDIRARHVKETHVLQALKESTGGKVAEGNVGAGTGTICYSFKGGIGTASRKIEADDNTYHLGVLLQTNFGRREELTIAGMPIGKRYKDTLLPRPGVPDGSIMVVIATDAPFTSRQLQRLCKRVAFGLGRTGTVGHHGSGDFVIAFSTANRYAHASQFSCDSILRLVETRLIDTFFTAVVESVQEAIYNALVAAETMTGRDGNTLYALPHDALVSMSNTT